MEKIKLNDGTVLEIQSGAENVISVISESVDEIISHFTDDNLERIEFMNDASMVSAIYTKKHLKKFSAEVTEDGYLVTIVLEDVNELYERIKTLEETVETLLAEKETTTEEVVEEVETENLEV